MTSRRILLLTVLALALLGIGYRVFFWKSDEAEIRDRIDTLASKCSFSEPINGAFYGIEVKAALKEAMTPDGTVEAMELGSGPLGVDEVAGGAVRLGGSYQSATLLVVDLHIELKGATATATGRLVLTANQRSPEPRVEQRKARFELVKLDGEWQIASITLARP